MCSELQARFGGGGQYFDPPLQTSFHPVAFVGSPFGRTVISSGRERSTMASLILMDSGSIRPFSFSAPLKGGENEASH